MAPAVPVLRVIINPGHGWGNVEAGRYDSGAVSGCGEEAALALQVAEDVQANCDRSGPSIILTPLCDNWKDNPTSLQCINLHPKDAHGKPLSHLNRVVEWVNRNCKPFDFLISIHLNDSPDESASGVEVYYSEGAPLVRKRQAVAAVEALAATLGIPDRGIRPSWQSQHPRLAILDDTNCPALLFEIGFVSSAGDVQAVQERGADAVLAAIEAIRSVK